MGADFPPLLAGLARLQHLVAGACLGTVMLSQTECWAEESDSSGDEGEGEGDGEGAFLWGGNIRYRPPRLCRIVTAERVTSFEDFHAAQQSRSRAYCESGGGGGGRRLEALQADWVKVEVSRCWSAAGQQPESPRQHDVDMWVSKHLF